MTTSRKPIPRKTSAATSRRTPMDAVASRSTRRRTPSKAKKTARTAMPSWLRNVLAIFIIAIFSGAFYYFFIRPYAYRWKPCYGLKAYGICVPCCYDVHGIDISHYQGDIDWLELMQSRLTDYPIEFVFMKATEGGDHGDDTFARNFSEAGKHGFIRGAYHFFSPKTDPLKQADFFIRTVKLAPGDLPPVLDVEVTGKKTKKELQQNIKRWLDRVEAHYGVKPILYTSYKFKTRYLDDSIFNTYPYWIAHYYVDSVKYEGKWHFWQHSDVGTVPGIDEDVDLNVFNGSLEELKRMTIK
ncbi:glycoside hydrolase family 25 protein [Bacteroides nordii]|nr:MAG: glycosyl hydrolase [Bacteroides sp. 41_26]